jgi:hypothetical protein
MVRATASAEMGRKEDRVDVRDAHDMGLPILCLRLTIASEVVLFYRNAAEALQFFRPVFTASILSPALADSHI